MTAATGVQNLHHNPFKSCHLINREAGACRLGRSSTYLPPGDALLEIQKLETVELAYFLYLPEALFDKAPGLETALGGSHRAGNMLSSARDSKCRLCTEAVAAVASPLCGAAQAIVAKSVI